MKTLNQDIQNRTFRPLYCLYGEESYLLRSFKLRIKEAVVNGDSMNYHHFEGRNATPRAIIDAADTLPFFADYRLIIAENTGLFKKSAEELVKYLPSMPETTILLFVEEDVNKNNRLYKAVAARGYITELGRQTPAYIEKWVLSILKKEQKQITRDTMTRFLELTGNNMELIRSELDKLLAYTWGRSVINAEDIAQICSVQISDHIFDMISAVSAKNRRRALSLYHDLLLLKVDPSQILALITRQFNQLLQIRQMSDQGMTSGEIAKTLKMNPYIAGKVRSQSRTFSVKELTDAVTVCVDAEASFKSGRLSGQIAAEMVLLQLSQ